MRVKVEKIKKEFKRRTILYTKKGRTQKERLASAVNRTIDENWRELYCRPINKIYVPITVSLSMLHCAPRNFI